MDDQRVNRLVFVLLCQLLATWVDHQLVNVYLGGLPASQSFRVCLSTACYVGGPPASQSFSVGFVMSTGCYVGGPDVAPQSSKSFIVCLSTGCFVGGPDVAPPPGLSFDICPCLPWLTCVSSGVSTVPLGEEGRPKSFSTHLFVL